MGSSKTTLFVKVILPASTPSILTGFRLSATNSTLIALVARGSRNGTLLRTATLAELKQ